LEDELFPQAMSLETLSAMEIPGDDCERAAMALAFARRQEDDQVMPDVDAAAWVEMVRSNTAMALVDPVYYFYLGAPAEVSPPEWAGDALDQVTLRYTWFGLGDEIEYELFFTPSESGYAVEGQINGEPYIDNVDEDLIQGIVDNLSGFIPVQQAAKLIVCMDNYPSWQLELTYREGRVVTLSTADSNIFYFGGPWFMNLEDRIYLQTTNGIVSAVSDIVERLDLPVGQAEGMYCSDLPNPILAQVFTQE
jgi:hypothetical protein